MPEQKILANKDAEQSILGSVFYDESTIKLLFDKLKPSDFYYLRHQIIYDTMLSLFKRTMPIDTTTVISALEDVKKLNDCGGAEYIFGLMDAVPSISNIESYINIVKDKAVQRNVVQLCNDIIKESSEEIPDSKVFLDNIEKRVFQVTSERSVSEFVEIGDLLNDVTQKIQQNAQNDGDVIGLDTGYHKLNNLTLGFQGSQLIILAARPSMGKTALGLNIACNIASLKSKPYVAFFSLEMGLDQLALRLISQKSNINQNELKTGKFSDASAWNRINYAVSELQNCNLLFDDSGTASVQDLRSLCRKKKSEGKLDFVVIDYLQLLKSTSHYENRVQEVSEISRTLKQMAKELDVPVLALSQLSRTIESRTDKHPVMSDLRESGSIEQDADIVMFIYRDDYYKKEASEKPNIADIEIAKNRSGMIGKFELIFRAECTNFIDMEERGN
ncbi:replicative DNA helicase [bacterium]|nr:replicative DNA helicase [bacterium]